MSKLVWTVPYRRKATHFKSLKTGNLFPMHGDVKYLNHGYGGIHKTKRTPTSDEEEFHDLPADEYPFTRVFEDPVIPAYISADEIKSSLIHMIETKQDAGDTKLLLEIYLKMRDKENKKD